jgi:hypothetical protein
MYVNSSVWSIFLSDILYYVGCWCLFLFYNSHGSTNRPSRHSPCWPSQHNETKPKYHYIFDKLQGASVHIGSMKYDKECVNSTVGVTLAQTFLTTSRFFGVSTVVQ